MLATALVALVGCDVESNSESDFDVEARGLMTDGFQLSGFVSGSGMTLNGFSMNGLNGINLDSWFWLNKVVEFDDGLTMCYCVTQSMQEEQAVYHPICCVDPYFTW